MAPSSATPATAPRRHVLFVDDEPSVLRAIERALRRQSSRWSMSFVAGAEQALDELAERPVDVVVSDLTMPGMDGVELFARVRTLYPDTVRILMSGNASGQASMCAVPVAHQFLGKPWDLLALVDRLERIFELRAMLANTAVRTLVTHMPCIPSVPERFAQLGNLLSGPAARLDEAVAIVARDPGLSAQLLHVTAFAHVTPDRPAASIPEAVRTVGKKQLETLALIGGVFGSTDDRPLPPGFAVEREMCHAVLVGKLTAAICGDDELGYAAGLLHDVGKLVCATQLPTEYEAIAAEAAERGAPIEEIETDVFGVSHAEIGGYLLGLWGLPRALVSAVSFHHDPLRAGRDGIGATAATHIASALVDEACGGDAVLDPDLVEALGAAAQLPTWRRAAARLVDAGDQPPRKSTSSSQSGASALRVNSVK